MRTEYESGSKHQFADNLLCKARPIEGLFLSGLNTTEPRSDIEKAFWAGVVSAMGLVEDGALVQDETWELPDDRSRN